MATHISARRDGALGWLFIGPQLLGTIAFGLVPFVFVIWYSLHDWNVLAGTFTFAGADNYQRLLGDRQVRESLVATVVFSGGLMVTNITLAMVLALLLNQKLRGTIMFRTFFFSPVVVSVVAWTVVWSFLLASNGGINGALASIGIDGPNWLREPAAAMASIIVVQVFKGVGMNMILFLAALQGIPGEIKESARIDGASPWRSFWSITLPLITPTLLLVMILTSMGALDVFAPVQLLTEGGPGNSTMVLSYYLYTKAFGEQQFGYASAIGVLLFVLVLSLTAIQWNLRKRWVHDEV